MPAVLVLLSAVCFATTGTAVALGAPDASPVAVGAGRVVVGGALLALLALPSLRGLRGRGRRTPGSAPTPVPWAAVLVGALGVVAYQPLFFAGTRASGVAVGTVVALGSAPLITGALAWVLTRQRPGARWLVATLVAVAGLVLLSLAAGGPVGPDPLGLAASVGAGASYAVLTLATKRLLDAGWSPAACTGAVFGVAAALSTPLLLVTAPSGLVGGGSAWLAVLWLGVVTTALAYTLFTRGLRSLAAPVVATLTLAEPLTATALGLLVLGEHLSLAQAAALALVAVGLVVLTVPGRRAPARAVTPAGVAA